MISKACYFIIKRVLAAEPPEPNGGESGGAEITNPALSKYLQDLLKTKGGVGFLAKFLPNLIVLFLIVASLAAFFVLIIGGIQWITSGGDKAATESARGRVTAAIIGLVLVFTVFAIMKVLGDFFGIDLLKINLEPLMLK